MLLVFSGRRASHPGRLPAALLATGCLIAVAGHPVATQEVGPPTVNGPIPSQGTPGDSTRNYVFYSTPMNLSDVGYVEEEYFVSGIATRYSVSAAPGGATPIGTMPYRTRMVVRRPARPANFAGVVVVDWQNVTGGHDLDTEWGQAGAFFVRAGWAWVGASVQRVGVHGFEPPNPFAGRGLKQWSPGRYASLDVTNADTVTDDSQSYDIYSQVAKTIKQPRGVNPFEGMTVRRVYAGGLSQSAAFLIRYYNNIHPIAKVYDGFLVGLGGGPPRLDLPTKLLKVLTENEVWRGQAAIRVPDTRTTHTWEIAGASHVDAALVSPDNDDFRAIIGGIRAREFGKQEPLRCAHPVASEVENWAVYSAAYAALDRWVTQDAPPPTAERIQVSVAPPAPGRATIVRDRHGIAVGGIRLPRVAVPTALNTGENQPAAVGDPLSGFCILYGAHLPFDTAIRKTLYVSHTAYMSEVRRLVDELVKTGFVLTDDAPTLIRNAENDFATAR